MAMNSGHRPGGGIASKQHVEVRIKTGSGAKAAHLGGVSQLGNKVGNHLTDKSATRYQGEPLFAGPGYNPSEYGNEIAAKTVCGPGGSRTVYKTGTQGQTGSGGPQKPAGRDILSAYGDDYRKP